MRFSQFKITIVNLFIVMLPFNIWAAESIKLSISTLQPKVPFEVLSNTQKLDVLNMSTKCDGCYEVQSAAPYEKVKSLFPSVVQERVFVTNHNLFFKDGRDRDLIFTPNGDAYFDTPALIGFNLMKLDNQTGKLQKLVNFYVGDHLVPHLRISTISISPDHKKMALAITSDPIYLFGSSYNDVIVLNIDHDPILVYDLGNKVFYGGYWSSLSDLFYFACPLAEHTVPTNATVCAIRF